MSNTLYPGSTERRKPTGSPVSMETRKEVAYGNSSHELPITKGGFLNYEGPVGVRSNSIGVDSGQRPRRVSETKFIQRSI